MYMKVFFRDCRNKLSLHKFALRKGLITASCVLLETGSDTMQVLHWTF